MRILIALIATLCGILLAQPAPYPALGSEPSATPPPAKKSSNSGRFKLFGKDLSGVCAIMCRVDTETGRVWTLRMSTRTSSEDKQETFFFWVYLPEDTANAWGENRLALLPTDSVY
jgi:hypothetical protein